MTDFFDWLSGNPDSLTIAAIALGSVVIAAVLFINASRRRARQQAAAADERRSHLRDM
jgi:hypothetical protein